MYRKFIVSFVISVFCSTAYSQVLSDQAKLSLLTCAAGDMAQDTWGHSAIRLVDPTNKIDVVYNYGTYDFEKSNFILNFLKGKLDYDLAVGSYGNFLRVYDYYERSVVEEDFDLAPAEVKRIYEFLRKNARPENKTYQYLFFHDNCSTRIRDLLANNLQGFNYVSEEQEYITFRQLLDTGLADKKWTDFGIDMILGQTCDVEADFKQAMFLPEFLSEYLSRARFTSSGSSTKLLKDKVLVVEHEEKRKLRNKPSLISPLLLFAFLAILEFYLLSNREKWNTKWLKTYDYAWVFVLAICSTIMLLMWFATEHETCEQNWNLLWANPLYIPMLYLFWKKGSGLRYVLGALIIACTASALLGWWIIPQQFHLAFVPIMIIMLLKLLRI